MSNNNYIRKSIDERRVVVTGLGTVTPLGLNTEETWQSAINAKSGISQITQFDTENYEVKIAGEVKNFDVEKYVSKKEQKKMDRFIHLSMAATEMALQDSGIEFTEEIKETAGVIIGVGIGGLPNIETQHSTLLNRGPRRVSPFFIPSVLTNLASGQISIKYGLKGLNYTVTSACASGSHSIGEAVNYIRKGAAKVMVAGGSESCVCPMAVAGFGAMKALSTKNEAPEKASRPWDKDRDGFVLAEGASTLILEDYEYAKNRGAEIYCEVTGYGYSSDAYHMTNPSQGGAGAAQAVRLALQDAGLNTNEVSYVNAHGTSTPAGDEVESAAIKSVFTDRAKDFCVSSTKSMTGHTLGAAGAIESVFSVLSLKTGIIPPTINLDNPSEDCDLDYVPHEARELSLKHVLNNSFGFGGTNSCLVFSKI